MFKNTPSESPVEINMICIPDEGKPDSTDPKITYARYLTPGIAGDEAFTENTDVKVLVRRSYQDGDDFSHKAAYIKWADRELPAVVWVPWSRRNTIIK